jgi:hypothetical protein
MSQNEKVKKIIRGLNKFYFQKTYTKEKELKSVTFLLSHLHELEDDPSVYGRETRTVPSTMAPHLKTKGLTI